MPTPPATTIRTVTPIQRSMGNSTLARLAFYRVRIGAGKTTDDPAGGEARPPARSQFADSLMGSHSLHLMFEFLKVGFERTQIVFGGDDARINLQDSSR